MTSRLDRQPPNGSRRAGHDDEANLLLRSLPERSYRRLRPHLTSHHCEVGDVLIEAGSVPEWVYFPRNFVGSLLVVLESGPPVESATVGCEGLIGICVVLGARRSSGRAIAQIAGESVRIRASALRKAMDGDPAVRRVLLRYANALTAQTAQSVACNSRHTLEQRCARWLLATHDRAGRDQFDLRQSFLAAMLGVHRPRVTIAAGRLQQAKLISYSRGKLEVIDRRGLEAVACECYATVKATFDRMLAMAAD